MTITKQKLLQAGNWAPALAVVLQSPVLSAGAKLAYSALGLFLRGCSLRASEKDIAAAYNVSARTFRRHLRELVAAKLIEVRGRNGRISTYTFLQPDTEKLQVEGVEKKPKPRSKLSAVEDRPRSKSTGDRGQNRPGTEVKTDRGARSKLTGVSGRSLIAKNQKVQKEKAARTQSLRNTRLSGTSETSDLHTVAAAAFLKKFFDSETAGKLLAEHSAAKVLYVQREFEAKRGEVKQPPALIRYLLKQPAREDLVAGHAEEMVGAYLKRLDQSASRRSNQPNRQSLGEWLAQQPDAEEIRARAEREVRLKLNGARANENLVRKAIQGFLERERKRRNWETVPALDL